VQINFSTVSTKDELDSGNAPNKVAENESNIENFEADLSEIEDPEILKLIYKCRNDNFEYGDIAILCRSGKISKIIANYLKNNDIPVISSDSVLLAFSKAVNLVISLIQVLAESNSLNRHQAIYLFHQTVLDEAMPTENEELKKICHNEGLKDYLEYFQKRGFDLEISSLVTQSVYEIAEYLIYAFQLLGQQKDQEYIFAFLDEILKFKLTKSDNLSDFLTYWEKNKSKLTIVPSSSNAVTISTIHKAKGLQYPVVIVPEAKWNLNMDTRSQLWVHLDELGYDELTEKNTENVLSVANLPHTKELENTEISDQYNDEAERYYLEAINLLYVALTRPEQRLYLLAKLIKNREGTKPPSNTISELLFEYLNHKGIYSAENEVYVINKGVPFQKSLQEKEINFECVSALQYGRANMAKLKISNSLEQIASKKSAEKGNKIHLVLSKIKFKTDIQAAINSCLEAGNIGIDETETIGEQINTIINHPKLNKYYEVGLKMANEIDILLPNGNSKRPDRVVFYKDKTVIIDYKTGIEMPEHKSQIRNYGNLFIDMNYPTPIMYLVYLENLKVIEC
jgi:ATP-dependent helicase/nuclease subunit A